MTAGLNNTGRIWRFTASKNNDDQGGAVPTGTVLYTPVFSRISSAKPTLALLEQGLETPEIFTAELSYTPFTVTGTFDVQENDQYEVMYPPVSPFYQKRFVIIGTQHNSYNDSRRFLRVTMRRIEEANSDLLLNSANQLNFDGFDDQLLWPTHTGLNNIYSGDFTVEAVMSPASNPGTGTVGTDLYTKADTVNYIGIFIYFENSNAFGQWTSFYIQNNLGEYIGADGDYAGHFDGKPHHYEFVFIRSTHTFKIFIDGVDSTTNPYTPHPNFVFPDDSSYPVWIVTADVPHGIWYKGGINWIRISNIARNTTNFTPPSLTLCPPSDQYTLFRMALDERTGVIAHDSSIYANNGLIVGATWQVTE